MSPRRPKQRVNSSSSTSSLSILFQIPITKNQNPLISRRRFEFPKPSLIVVMPRATSKRKAPSSTSASDVVSTRPGAGKKGKKEVDKIGSLFDGYANKSLDMIDPEGIVSLCSHLGVDHTDVRILMLAWKMKAEKQGYFSREEWRRGLKDLNADTIAKLKKALPGLEKELMATPKFEVFYAFAFQYCLTEDRQKSVDTETVCELLNLVLGPKYRSQVDLLIKYLKVQTEYRALNADQWRHFYRFCKEISFPDLEDYDSDQAWPVIIDNLVEWMKENKQN